MPGRLRVCSARSLGHPFGTVPRLLLTCLSTEAVRTKNQELVLESSLAEFMRALGLQPNGGRNGTVTRQTPRCGTGGPD
jgi:hypothetical protein